MRPVEVEDVCNAGMDMEDEEQVNVVPWKVDVVYWAVLLLMLPCFAIGGFGVGWSSTWLALSVQDFSECGSFSAHSPAPSLPSLRPFSAVPMQPAEPYDAVTLDRLFCVGKDPVAAAFCR